MNVIVIRVNKVERVRIKSTDLPAAVHLDGQVNIVIVVIFIVIVIIWLLFPFS